MSQEDKSKIKLSEHLNIKEVKELIEKNTKLSDSQMEQHINNNKIKDFKVPEAYFKQA